MEIKQIHYFLALAETLNFTRAADKCHVSQPALTQSIMRLEEELGGRLIHRQGRDTRLTDLGLTLRSHFEDIEKTRQMALDTARSFVGSQAPELNIGLMCSVGPRMLWSFLDDFQADHPGMLLLLHDVQFKAIPELLLSGGLDAVFCTSHGTHDKRLSYMALFNERMVVAFPPGHKFSAMARVPLHSVAKEKYVDRLNCEYRDEFFDYCDENDVELQITFRSQREDWIQVLVREGAGVTTIPEYLLIPPMLDFRPIEEPSLEHQIEFAVAERSDVSPALEALLEHAQSFPWLQSISNSPPEIS